MQMYRLRELKREDISIINTWRNDKELIDYLGAPFRYINEEVDVLWFENYMKNRSTSVRCAIVDDDDKILGLISLMSIDYLNQSAVLHIMIGNSNNHNKGIGTFAVEEILNHAFNNLNLHRVELSVLDSNDRAKHVYEKVGFICEGKKRRAVFKNGDFVDLVLYSILKEDFKTD